MEIPVPTIEDYANGGKTIGYIYCGGTPAGMFTLSDTCRSGAAEAVRELKKIGIRTALLTGDSHTAAMHTNDQVRALCLANRDHGFVYINIWTLFGLH